MTPNVGTSDETGEEEVKKSLFSPSIVFNALISRVPRLIGWDDDDYRVAIERIADTYQGYILKPCQNLKEDGEDAGKNKRPNSNNFTSDDAVDLVFNDDVKERKFYKQLLTAAQYQRDAYIMGTQHAQLRNAERAADVIASLERQVQRDTLELKESDEESDEFVFPYEPLPPQTPTYREFMRIYPSVNQSSLGCHQVNSLSAWFIPSDTMHNSILPTVLWSITKPRTPPYNLPHGGPLYRQISRSMVNLVPLGQPLVDVAVKSNVLYVLKDLTIQGWVKGATNGYVSNMQSDAEDDSMGGKFVTTKSVNIRTNEGVRNNIQS